MELFLSGKRAVVTGASRGIGKAIASSLAAEGAHVALIARTESVLSATASELRSAGHVAFGCPGDVSTPEGAEAVMKRAITELGGIDLLINNVGGSLGSGGFDTIGREDWERVVGLNLGGVVWPSLHATAAMKAQGAGVIVHITSISGRELCSSAPYAAAKSALHGLTKEMAYDLAPFGIRVVAVAPGSILFPGGSWARRQAADPALIAKKIESELPFGRFGRPEEVADVVTFLCSPRASWVSGSTVVVDGVQGRAL